jgi:hypothetical protein
MCALQGFGKGFWGNKWRFKIFDGFYTHPKDPETGNIVDVSRRFYHLIQRLDAAIKGEDPWLNKQFETDEEMKKEIANKDVVKEVWCSGVWLLVGEQGCTHSPIRDFARQNLCTLESHNFLHPSIHSTAKCGLLCYESVPRKSRKPRPSAELHLNRCSLTSTFWRSVYTCRPRNRTCSATGIICHPSAHVHVHASTTITWYG